MRNHGEVTPSQLHELYAQVDGVFFPSLLEASSATPLEANVLGIPLVASNRDFVRTTAETFALFEPTDPLDTASALARLALNLGEAWEEAAAIAIRRRKQVAKRGRTENYLKIIAGHLQQQGRSRGS